MSATKQTTIWCDVYLCESFVQIDTPTVREAERVARLSGWRCLRVGDFCPKHRKDATDDR